MRFAASLSVSVREGVPCGQDVHTRFGARPFLRGPKAAEEGLDWDRGRCNSPAESKGAGRLGPLCQNREIWTC